MRKLLNQVIQWALREEDSRELRIGKCETVRSDSMPSCRIAVMRAMNGRILEVSTYKPTNHGPDWTNEMFIVPEDQTLTEALTTLLVLKGLNT